MKLKLQYIIAAAHIGSALMASATVTLNFNAPFAGGVSSNFADADSNILNGLYWGVIVDNTGNGVLSSYLTVTPTTSGIIQLSTPLGDLTDDTLIFSSALSLDTGNPSPPGLGFTEGDFITPGGNGGITAISNLSLAGGVNAGDSFYIVWFDDTDASKAGILSDASFLLPADGSSNDYDSPFIGVDPVRPADGSALSFVPEPSSIALLGFGLVGFTLRRRR